MLGLRSWKARVALGAAIAITGSSLGLYLAFRPQPHSQLPPLAQTTAPPVVDVGSTTVANPGAAEYLSVVSTNPEGHAVGAKVTTPIAFSFSLPVDPATVQPYFSVLPAMTGVFTQGSQPQDVVFTPDGAFATGGAVNVVLRKGLASLDGFVLQDDYTFTFATQVAANNVMFQSGNSSGSLFTSQSGALDFSFQIGEGVPPNVTLQTFRATAGDLVKSFVYTPDGQFVTRLIDTSGMQLMDTKVQLNQTDKYKIAQPDGIYLLLVSDPDGQYGSAWVDFSKYAVLLRQDDQKIVVAGEDLSTGDTGLKFDIAFYGLQGTVKKVISGSFTGTGEFMAPYPAKLDLAIATTAGQEVVIPMGVPGANGDTKIMAGLSQQAQIFLTTDRAAYRKGETVRFAGVVRLSNDQAYTVPAAMKVVVSVTSESYTVLLRKTVTVASHGSFDGSSVMPAGAFNSKGTNAQIALTAAPTSPHVLGDFSNSGAYIVALAPHTPASTLTVTFDKPSYVAHDTVVASIVGTDNKGLPLAGAIKLNLYSTQHEMAPREIATFPAPGPWGIAVKSNVSVQFDASGHATYSFAANAAKKVADQEVTLSAAYGTGTFASLAAKSTIVYQAADEVFLLPSRSLYANGDQVIAPFVVETVAGERVGNATVAYEIDKTDYKDSKEITTVVSSGTVTTDENGIGTVSTKAPAPAYNLILKVKGKDGAGNVFQDVKSLTVFAGSSPFEGYDGTDQLIQLSVSTDKIAYNVGDSAHLVVRSPASLKVLMATERGRIHQYKWVTLAKGDNPLTLDVTPDLAPGITLVFAYFQDGGYATEALPLFVNDPTHVLSMTVTPDQPTYAAGQTAHLDITIKDSAGNPVAATLLVDGYAASMSTYKLLDQAPIAGAFWVPAPRGTNASSSLVGIGNYGGRCGGGPGPTIQPAATNAGALVVWLPAVTTDATGHATVDVLIAKTTVRLALFAATPSASVGQVEMDVPVQ